MKRLIDCSVCGWPFLKDTREIKRSSVHLCSKECISVQRKRPRNQITKECIICKTPVTRAKSYMTENCCCSKACTDTYISMRLSRLNRELNPTRMIPETRAKLREARINTGEGKTYAKTYGRHTHRIVAEEILGRPLLPGEVVHHEDENKRNNDPSNIKIFSSQAEHARYHASKNPINPKAREN